MDLGRVVRDLVNHFKAELDNLMEMANTVASERGRLGDSTTCIYLLAIGNAMVQLINDAVLFTGVVRKDLTERLIARVLMIRADAKLIDAYVERGWASQDQANAAKEALRIEEDRLEEVYNSVSSVISQVYDEIVNYGKQKLSEFAQLYKTIGCNAIIAI